MQQSQFDFDFNPDPPFEGSALWTPRDIWVKLNQRILEHLREDRRIERKDHKTPSLDDLAKY
jgi:ATP-dependent DNA helicase RecG